MPELENLVDVEDASDVNDVTDVEDANDVVGDSLEDTESNNNDVEDANDVVDDSNKSDFVSRKEYETLLEERERLTQQVKMTEGRLKKTFKKDDRNQQQQQYTQDQNQQQVQGNFQQTNSEDLSPEEAQLNNFIGKFVQKEIEPIKQMMSQFGQVVEASNKIARNKESFSKTFPSLTLKDITSVMKKDGWDGLAIEEVEMGLHDPSELGDLAVKAYQAKFTQDGNKTVEKLKNATNKSTVKLDNSGSAVKGSNLVKKIDSMSEEEQRAYYEKHPSASEQYLKEKYGF